MTESYWKPERIELLTTSWNAGHNAREIAAALVQRFGGRVSRNAVVSKVHRLGLKMHQPSNSWRNQPSKRPQ
jgi:hypothetical protein